MPGTCADHGTAGRGTGLPNRYRIRASTTLGTSRAPARSRSAIASARTCPASRPASSAPRRVRHSHRALVARLAAVFGGQGGQEQVAVALLPSGRSLRGPDRVQQGQVVGVGEGLVAGLGGRELLAVVVQ